MNTRHDVIIIGGGPAGLAVGGTLCGAGLDTMIVEKGALADSVARFPYYMKFFSSSNLVELSGFPLITADDKPTRAEYLNYLRRFAQEKKLQVLTEHRVTAVQRDGDGFRVSGTDMFGEPFGAGARFVVLATGAYDQPRLLGVPGEDLPHVSHYFTEVHPYAGKRVAIVGGRNSAVEAALLLWRAGSQVTIVCRGRELAGVKYWILPDMKNRIDAGDIHALFNTRVVEIRPHDIQVQTAEEPVAALPVDFVLTLTGYQPDVSLLRSSGIEVDESTCRPAHDPRTLETGVPGLYVAGVITAGNISGEVFIENSRHHGELILASIREKLGRHGE